MIVRPIAFFARVALMLLACAAFSTAIGADSQPKPFAAGDASRGEMMSNKDCVGCHAQRFGGDGSKMYLRSDRKVHTPAQLMAQIATCNTQLGTNYFPEEEEHVAAYLNLQYYKFKP